MTDEPRIRRHPSPWESPWDLGHGLAAVGPGWWPLVRAAFLEAEEWPEASVTMVRQKHCLLDILVGPCPREFSQGLRRRYREASRTICEACGAPAEPAVMPRNTRTHCERCKNRLRELEWDERSLWMEHAGVWLPEWGN